ncbi:MAG: hypothetical protein K2G04_05625 [Oscillospiraceae bacterium]|nr:hypothetical protein [Oscillospiraceae bacterium]
MEFDNRYASNGKGNAGVALGIVGTALGALNSIGGGLWNGGNCNRAGWGNCGSCSENTPVTRYDMQMQQELAAKDSKIALLEANTYNDQKNIEMYKYVDGRFREFEAALAQQAVFNQKTADSFDLVRKDIEIEAERRCCGDNAIVNYANATFYPKMVADVTVGTTQTAQTLYNPIPKCGGCCGNSN